MTNTTRTASALSPRAAGIVAAVAACAEAALGLPANDNAGLAFRLEDDAPFIDNVAFGVEVVDRNAAALAPAIAATAPSLWYAYAAKYGRAAVRMSLKQPYARSVNRRVRTLHAFLRVAGVAAEWG